MAYIHKGIKREAIELLDSVISDAIISKFLDISFVHQSISILHCIGNPANPADKYDAEQRGFVKIKKRELKALKSILKKLSTLRISGDVAPKLLIEVFTVKVLLSDLQGLDNFSFTHKEERILSINHCTSFLEMLRLDLEKIEMKLQASLLENRNEITH
jgi:hypothetical protein